MDWEFTKIELTRPVRRHLHPDLSAVSHYV